MKKQAKVHFQVIYEGCPLSACAWNVNLELTIYEVRVTCKRCRDIVRRTRKAVVR